MKGGPFEARREMRQQNLKEQPGTDSVPQGKEDDSLGLLARKRSRQSYTVYLERDLMGRVQRLAKQRGVAASAVVEACIKMSLEQLEG